MPAETGTIATVLTPAIGGQGFQYASELVMEYSSQAPVMLTALAADEGNGSYGPPPITLPSTGGLPAKYNTKLGANKWQLLWFEFQSSDPAMQIYMEGFVVDVKSWGDTSAYRKVRPFTPSGGEGDEK